MQMYKQTSSSGINALKLAVFLGEERGLRLWIPVGKRFVFQAFPLLELGLPIVKKSPIGLFFYA